LFIIPYEERSMANSRSSLINQFSPLQVGSVTELIESLSANSPISWAMQMIDENPDAHALPIERDGMIIGVLESRLIKELNESTWKKFWQRDLDAYIKTSTIVLDAFEHIESVLPHLMKENEESGVNYFVVYYRRSYMGVVGLNRLIDQANLLRKQDMDRARDVQQALLSRPRLKDTRIDCRFFIRMAHEVGGDFYQEFAFDENRFLLACFDVSGKNLAASLTTTGIGAFFSALRYFGASESYRSTDLTPRMNAYLRDLIPTDTFIAAVLFYIDFAQKTVKIQNMGYSPVYAFVPGGPKVTCKVLKPNLAPLGIELDQSDKTSEYTLPIVNDLRIFTYSDGFTDLENTDQIMYGDERAKDFILAHHGDSSAHFMPAFEKEIDVWRDKASQKDDITMMSLRFQDC
jgi:phosphoserine phosphatase RsbU/P